MSKTVRTRFAPSPTGFLHVGGVRTALFKYLFAKNKKGSFILRIDDTDRERLVEEAEQHIMESLRWLELNWDEGPDTKEAFGPYRQSDRLKIYQDFAKKLEEKGWLYPCWCSSERLNDLRVQAQTSHTAFKYDHHCLDSPGDKSKPHVLRFRIPDEDATISWTDIVKGLVSVESKDLDDFVAIKSDGWPTYHFSSVVDDHTMEITHVVRGDEWVASTPKHLMLYQAFGWTPPAYAHVPTILGPDGNKKLSKRDGAKDILDYRNEGYLPEALINFLATLGWNDGTEQEVFSRKELIEKFSLERVQKSGARFDEKRLLWLNGAHVRLLPLNDLFEKVKDYWPVEAAKYPEDYKKRVLDLVQERLKIFKELPELTNFFFTDLPQDPELIANHKQLKKLSHDELKELLETSKTEFEKIEFTKDNLIKILNDLLEKTGQKPVVLFSLIRIATTQAPASPGLAETMELITKEVCLKRIEKQLNALSK